MEDEDGQRRKEIVKKKNFGEIRCCMWFKRPPSTLSACVQVHLR